MNTANTLRFGWLPDSQTYETDRIIINPLKDFDEAVSAVHVLGHIHKKWFYPPLQAYANGENDSRPPVPMPWFALPETHQIFNKTNTCIPGFLEFVILLFGWSQGLRLYPEGHGHHYRVATEVGMLTDFRIMDIDVEKYLCLVEEFWRNHYETGAAAGLFAAVHWYLYSCSYHQQFERFMNQYQVLDACFHVYCTIKGEKVDKFKHFMRAKVLCDNLGLQMPAWAIAIEGRKTTPLAVIRNEVIHEAKWGGAPIGFVCLAGDFQNILLELKNFNCRLIASLLGVTGSYVFSSSQTRQPRRLNF